MEKTVAAHHGCIKTAFAAAEPVPADLPPPPLPDEYCDVRGRPRPLVARTRSRYAAVQELVAAGRSLRGISRDLDLDYYTVRRYARADSLDALLAPAIHRRTLLDAYKPWLYEQFTLGQRNASHLYRQIREQGYTGDRSNVGRYIRLLKAGMVTPPAPRLIPAPRATASWLLTHPERLQPDHTVTLRDVRAAVLPSSLRQSRATASRRRCSGGGAAHDQNGAGPRPANDINTCVASSLRMPVTAT
ncbi:hypothetical protein, partial [Micromonospora coerulea]|uniref:hypothetical protein n=1 Tax=Micromonospora coerulea TaxID=47856 RepID=UPI003D15CF87